jgi:hypothetical protein
MLLRPACIALCLLALAARAKAQSSAEPAKTSLTIYNQDFALIRSPLTLTLHAGTNDISETHVTSQLEPDSVVLLDRATGRPIPILEQNYDGSLRVQAQMLAKFEGRAIDFEVTDSTGTKIVPGKIIRAGSVPQFDLLDRYGQNYYYQSLNDPYKAEPLIEIDGHLRYGLPGIPLFPPDTPGLTLQPTLHWLISAEKPDRLNAELDYISRGLRWDAVYNVIAPPQTGPDTSAQSLELIGWVNVTNESGTDFRNASLQLMAGDISKLTDNNGNMAFAGGAIGGAVSVNGPADQQKITQKSFDEYHLYDLHRATTLLDHQTKQVEFLNVVNIPAHRVYIYDGLSFDNEPNQMRYYQWNQREFGGKPNPKVWIMQEFKNSEANRLGMPLPKGRMRFYRRDTDGTLQFIGENTIDHTPKDETVRVYLGNAFDLTGTRTQTDFIDRQQDRTLVETYKVALHNAKDSPATVRVVEHLYRTATWEITAHSDPFTKRDFQSIEFEADVPAHGEKELTYTVTYTW